MKSPVRELLSLTALNLPDVGCVYWESLTIQMDLPSKRLCMETHSARAPNSVLLQSFNTIRDVQRQLAELVGTKPTPAILAAQIALWSVLLSEVGTIRECLEHGSIGKKIEVESGSKFQHDSALWRAPALQAIQPPSVSSVQPRTHRGKFDAH